MADDILKDVRDLLNAAPTLSYIHSAGGVRIISEMDNIDHQMKTPFVIIEDGIDADIQHLSSRVIWRGMNVKVRCIQRIFEKMEVIIGSSFNRGVEEIADDVRTVLDMDRMNGKYARAYWQSSEQAAAIGDGNIHLIEKTLNFSYVRIET
jgi:hypothetical protein